MKPAQLSLIATLALAMTAAVRVAAAEPPIVTGNGCLLTFSKTRVPIVAGTDRDVMLAWSMITGAVRREEVRRQRATKVACPSTASQVPAVPGTVSLTRSAKPSFDVTDDGLEIGLRYHFGPNIRR